MQAKFLDQLVDLFVKTKTKNEMEDLLVGLLTPKELREIPTRVQIVKMLKKGVPKHKIASKLGTGIATVTRGSNELKKGRFKHV